jgi:hypothetical protein
MISKRMNAIIAVSLMGFCQGDANQTYLRANAQTRAYAQKQNAIAMEQEVTQTIAQSASSFAQGGAKGKNQISMESVSDSQIRAKLTALKPDGFDMTEVEIDDYIKQIGRNNDLKALQTLLDRNQRQRSASDDEELPEYLFRK